jgi:hypothetical protein
MGRMKAAKMIHNPLAFAHTHSAHTNVQRDQWEIHAIVSKLAIPSWAHATRTLLVIYRMGSDRLARAALPSLMLQVDTIRPQPHSDAGVDGRYGKWGCTCL